MVLTVGFDLDMTLLDTRPGIKATYDALAAETGDSRITDYWKFVLDDKRDGAKVYMQRLLDSSTTTRGYRVDEILAGKYGEPGAALMLFRTYPRVPFWENVHEDEPFWTDTGRLNSYCDIPEALEYGHFAESHFRLAMTAGVAVGTTEINLNLVASRFLSLPRE